MITIDPEFKNLIPALTKDEYSGLESSIVKEGCRDPIVLWNDTIIDGHNRFEICTKHDIQFKTHKINFESREDVIDWMCSNQLSRRNLTDANKTYLLGKQYQIRKKKEWSRHPVGDQNDLLPKTAEIIAKEQKVSAPTVKRAAEYAEAIDTITETIGKETTDKILSGEIEMMLLNWQSHQRD